MKGLEKGRDKVKKICDVLRHETLEPAKQEAQDIVSLAKREAEEIINRARKEAKKISQEAEEEIVRQKNVFEASLKQACRQTIEVLKADIEHKLFQPELESFLSKPLQDPQIIAKLIEKVIAALEKDGIDADLSAYIPAAVPARAVNEFLAKKILERLKEKSVLLGGITGGVEVKLHNQNITVEISDVSLKEILAQFIRKDFRELFFGAP